jgi:hypothetical protein
MRLVALVVAGLVTGAAPALAQYAPRSVVPVGPMPPEGVFQMVRQMGLEPVGPPVRNGPVYFQRAADYYGKPLRVVIDASRAQVVSVEGIGGPPMLHRGPYASAGAPYWRGPYGPYGAMAPDDDDDFAPPGSIMAPHAQPPRAGVPPNVPGQFPQTGLPQKPKAKSAAVTQHPPTPRKRPAAAPQGMAGSVEPLQSAPAAAPAPAPAAKPASPDMTPVAPLY